MRETTSDASVTTSFSPPARTETPARPSGTCPNCAAEALGRFCHACGGRVDVSRLTLRALGSEVLAQLIELDHGVVHTLVELVKRPGPTIRGYFAGRRRGLTSPLAFVALSVALSLLVTTALPDYQAARDAQFKQLDAYRGLYSTTQFDFFVRLEHTAAESKALLLTILLIPTTLTMRFMFRKHRLNLAETGAVVSYMYGTATFVGLLFSVPLLLMGRPNDETTVAMILTAVFLIHLAFGVYGRSFSTTWRALWAGTLGLLFMQVCLIITPFLIAR